MSQALYDYSLCLVYYIENVVYVENENLHMKSKGIQVQRAYVKNDLIEKMKICKVGITPSFTFVKRPELEYDVMLRYESDKSMKHKVKYKDHDFYFHKYTVCDILKL